MYSVFKKIMININDLNLLKNSVKYQLGWYLLLVFLFVTMLGGCTQPPKKVVQAPVKKKVVVKKVKPGKVVIILSDSLPAFTEISRSLSAKLGKRAIVYDLKGDLSRGKKILDNVRKLKKKQVVSIGLLASKVANILTDTQVIFCQVFNYEDLKLIKPSMKGVSISPNHAFIFNLWKKIDPTLKNVAVVTGSNKESLINPAIRVAKRYGITLTHEVVKTDLDLIYAIKHLPPHVKGIWLLPDNRVLSVRVIRDLMNYSVKHGKQVAVLQTELLKLGALFSTHSKTKEVVRQTLKRLKKSSGKKRIPGPALQMLRTSKISINSKIAKLLGLTIPSQYQKYAYD